MRRVIRWGLGVAAAQGLLVMALAWLLPGFHVGGPMSAAAVAVIVIVGQALTWSSVYRLAAAFHPLLFPVLCFALAGLLMVALSELLSQTAAVDARVDGVLTGVLVVCGLASGNALLGALFSLGDDRAFDWFVTRPLRGKYAAAGVVTGRPGVLFLEIDGLAEPILRRALDDGCMPTLRRWVEGGDHRITGWEPDLSSQTSASQAGILLGDNTGIPAFRWYDKAAGAVMVSSSMATARELERRLSRGEGLLRDGASRWNVFSGDAPDSVCTYSTFGDRRRARSSDYLAYLVNPYMLPRTAALFLGDIVRERWQAWRQGRRGEQPRIRRGLRYAVVRAATTTLMQEAALFMLIADVFRGTPSVYVTFFAYDEVAHHSGIDRADAFKVLAKLDRAIATLARATASAPRPYHVVILSDHGQSMGATFRQRHGQTLGDLVTSLVSPDDRVTVDDRPLEDWGHLNLALSEAIRSGGDRRAARLLQRTLSGRTGGDRVAAEWPDDRGALGTASPERGIAPAPVADRSDVVVLASGNLGLVSFPRWAERMTYEQIVDHVPALISGLVTHPGIGFVMVRSESEGGLAIGPDGIHFLDHGYAVGVDPLAGYGARAAAHLRRTDGFANAPDILVMSRYDPTTGEVVAFEELVGSHGGLGGPQTEPFVLHPVTLDAGTSQIVGAAALHRVLRGWVDAGAREPGR